MPDPVLIGKRYDAPELVVALFGAGLGILGGAWLWWLEYENVALPLLGVGAVAAVAAGFFAFRVHTARRWLTATDTGLVLTDGQGEHEFADENVTDIGVASRSVSVGGKRKAFERKCHLVLRAGDATTTLDFTYTPDLNKPDPLADFFDRNVDRLTERADQTLATGESLTGTGWVLNADALTHGDGDGRIVVKMSSLDAVDVVDGDVCVWVGQSDRAVVRVPCGSLNSEILERLLRRRLEARPQRTADETDGPGLGRVVFERDHSIPQQSMTGGLILGGFFWVAMSAAAIDAWGYPWNILLPVTIPLVVGLGYGAVWLFRENVLRCHARGVTRTVWCRTREIRYADVGTFVYKATRHLTNGIYSGTTIEMQFLPWRGGPGDAVSYAAMVSHSDDELEKLRDLISRAIAEGMREKLDAGLPVDWVGGARFTRKGLEAGSSNFFGRRDKIVVPYSDLLEYDLRQGEFYLYGNDDGKPAKVFSGPVSGPNFFPGLYVLLGLTRIPARGEAADKK